MTRVRFATARDVREAFPQIAVAMATKLDDTPSIAFLDHLVGLGRPAEGVSFLAHLLPRRESVWWAAKCVRAEPDAWAPDEEALITTAECWVRDLDEESRLTALALGDAGDAGRAATWVARAAAWSGGSIIANGAANLLSQPFMTPAAARGAILIAAKANVDHLAFLRACIDRGRTFLAAKS